MHSLQLPQAAVPMPGRDLRAPGLQAVTCRRLHKHVLQIQGACMHGTVMRMCTRWCLHRLSGLVPW